MRVFLYEYITGGGLLALDDATPPSGSLLREGAAMLKSLAQDFCAVPDVEVSILRDARITSLVPPSVVERVVNSSEEHVKQFDAGAAEADWTVVIAPEFDRVLLNCVRRVESVGGRLLGPEPSFVELGTYKDATLAHLAALGIRTPHGFQFRGGDPVPGSLHFPAVLKPLDGAGSQGINVIATRDAFPQVPCGTFWLEEFQPGAPVSISVFSGPKGRVFLPASQQLLSDDGTLGYLGGRLPIDEPLRSRAESLAVSVVDALPSFLGYVGIDVILGESEELDCVIELNPRLTTSYVGLRHATQQNLAATVLELAEGASPELCFDLSPLEFSADGTILPSQIGDEKTR
ncbi:MAG: hypothetical protein CMJ64_19780 [Planctomycetaceae bacterium]|nr:hypothetical protein [Planctomycetaceae bacterium]